MPRRVSSPIFVGRVAERAALSEALERAIAGAPALVLISGEAGVGKSRLLTEIAALAGTMGGATVSGVCHDVAAGTLPFAPFVEIVRELERAGLMPALPSAARDELRRLVPELGRSGTEDHGAGQAAQGRLFAAVRDALAVASAFSLVLVTIEDLHWADASTLDLVSYLARSLQAERCLIVMTARLETLPRRHPLVGLVAELARLPAFERLDLTRFDEGELVQQLTGILGGVPDAAMARQVFERSDGNAFFAEELVASGGVGDSPLPASLREVLAARLAALDEVTQRVVRVAAVTGRVVSHDLLERVAGIPSPELIAALREAVDQRVLLHVDEPAPGYAFRHALVREAAVDELLTAERIAIHRAVADALEGDDALEPAGELVRTGQLAYHAMAAGDRSRALTASLAAVAVAERASAHAEAEGHLDRALELWPKIPDAADRAGLDHAALLAWTARAAASAGHQARAVTLARAALEESDALATDRRVEILLALFDYAWEAADIGTARDVVDEVMPLVRQERSARSAQAFAADALLGWHVGRYPAALGSATEAIAIARACGARRELARALIVLGQIQTHLGETTRADVALVEAMAILEGTGDADLRVRACRWRAWSRFIDGRFEESLALHRVGLEIARREGADGRYGVSQLDGVFENLIELGRWAEARATADRILARVTMSFEMVYTHMSLARLDMFEGRFGDADREVALASEMTAVGPHRVWQLEDAIALAYATGRFADGRRRMEEVLAASAEPSHDATLWWSLLKGLAGEADRADAARRRRRTVEVEEAVTAGRRFAEILRSSARRAIEADGSGPMARAVLRSADAEESRLEGRSDPGLWTAAVDARRDFEQPWELAYARYRLAEAILSAGGSAAEAAVPLREAHTVATELAATPLRLALEGLASRARIPLAASTDPSEVEPRSTSALTTREREVLSLVAAGHTNREIGDRLFISEKTVSVHVTHAMDKLGALSRYEAAATATRLGWLGTALGSGSGPA